MKVNCRVLKLSIILSIGLLISIFVMSIYVVRSCDKTLEIILNVIIGTFGSSLVVLLMTIPTYNDSKRQLLKKYRLEAERLTKIIATSHYLYNEYSDDLVVSYVNQINNKKMEIELFGSSSTKNDNDGKKYKDELINEYINNHFNLKGVQPDESLKKYAGKCVDKQIEKIRIKAKKICSQYIDVSKESTIDLNYMLGDMEFLSGKKHYLKINNNIYEPLMETLNDIKEECVHFKLFLEGEGNESIILQKIFDLQKKLFEVKITENDKTKNIIINNKIMDKMLLNMEEFRTDMYRIKPEKIQLYPVESITYYKKLV